MKLVTLTKEQEKQLKESKTYSYYDKEKGASARYDKGFRVKTTEEEDKAMSKFAKENQDKYNLASENCKDLVQDSLEEAGIETTPMITPNQWYNQAEPSLEHRGKITQKYEANK